MLTWAMAVSLLLSAPALKEVRKPARAPVGRWAVERAELNGVVLIKSLDKHTILQFTEKSFSLELCGIEVSMAKADFYELDGQTMMEYWPVGKDRPVRAIWKLDGDSLLLCEGFPGDKCPTEFKADEGSNRGLWVLKRAEK
jgi:hypothetical protein